MAHDHRDRGARVVAARRLRVAIARPRAVAGGQSPKEADQAKQQAAAADHAAAQQPAGVERNPLRAAAVHEHSRAARPTC